MATSNIAGVPISKANQKKLVAAVLAAADDRGYCSETRNILSDLGFDIEPEKTTVTVQVIVSVTPGTDLDEVKRNLYTEYDGAQYDNVEILSTTAV